MKTLRFLILIISTLSVYSHIEGQYVWDVKYHIESDRTEITADTINIKVINLANPDRLTLTGSVNSLEIKNNDIIKIHRSDKYFRLYIRNDTLILQEPEIDLFLAGSNKKFSIYFRNPEKVILNHIKIVKNQNTLFYDALLLRKGATPDQKKMIMEKYFIVTPNILLFDTLNILKYGDLQSSVTVTSSVFSSIGGLDVSRYTDGLAKFLVKRAKQELNTSFFENFRKTLNDTVNKDLRILFPSTHNTLQTIGEEIYNYEHYLSVLRENFEYDFKTLPDHIPTLIYENEEYFSTESELRSGLLVSSKLATGLREKKHPGRLISEIDDDDLKGFSSDIKHSLYMIRELTDAIRDTATAEGSNYWIDKIKIKGMLKDTVLLKLFTGLYLERLKVSDSIICKKLLSNTDIILDLLPLVDDIAEQTGRINHIISSANESQDISPETAISYIDAVTDIFFTMNKSFSILGKNKENKNVVNFLSCIKNSNALVSNLSRERYNSALFNMIELYKLSGRSNEKNLNWFLHYGTFMAGILSAESSDDIAQALETYAMPSGSARIKRNSYFNIALNSYIGVQFGYELRDENPVLSITAPLGLAFSWGFPSGSFSIYPSVIDIGAIAAYRFRENDSEIAKIYLREIISPGIFFSYGLKDYPVSINIGAQAAPLLTKIGSELLIERPVRMSCSFVVDIPLLNLYNKKERIKK
jgi:hypothetical protein